MNLPRDPLNHSCDRCASHDLDNPWLGGRWIDRHDTLCQHVVVDGQCSLSHDDHLCHKSCM